MRLNKYALYSYQDLHKMFGHPTGHCRICEEVIETTVKSRNNPATTLVITSVCAWYCEWHCPFKYYSHNHYWSFEDDRPILIS